MKIDAKVRQRAIELIQRGEYLTAVQLEVGSLEDYAADNESVGWLASARHLITVIYPDPTSTFNLMAIPGPGSVRYNVGNVVAILKGLLADVDAGVVTKVADAARAEVFDDFLDQAAHYLNANRVSQAGVIAGVVFEDTIRRACERRGIAQRGVEIERLITALKNAEAFGEVRAKRCRAAAGVRTKATHAQWDEFNKDDVDATIRLSRELIDSLLA